MTQQILTGVFVCSLAFVAVPSAQTAAPSRSTAASEQAQTFEGCLGSGAKDGEFALSAGSQRVAVVAASGVDLAPHVNHRVQITGTVEQGDGGAAVVRASAVKMVATSCNAS